MMVMVMLCWWLHTMRSDMERNGLRVFRSASSFQLSKSLSSFPVPSLYTERHRSGLLALLVLPPLAYHNPWPAGLHVVIGKHVPQNSVLLAGNVQSAYHGSPKPCFRSLISVEATDHMFGLINRQHSLGRYGTTMMTITFDIVAISTIYKPG